MSRREPRRPSRRLTRPSTRTRPTRRLHQRQLPRRRAQPAVRAAHLEFGRRLPRHRTVSDQVADDTQQHPRAAVTAKPPPRQAQRGDGRVRRHRRQGQGRRRRRAAAAARATAVSKKAALTRAGGRVQGAVQPALRAGEGSRQQRPPSALGPRSRWPQAAALQPRGAADRRRRGPAGGRSRPPRRPQPGRRRCGTARRSRRGPQLVQFGRVQQFRRRRSLQPGGLVRWSATRPARSRAKAALSRSASRTSTRRRPGRLRLLGSDLLGLGAGRCVDPAQLGRTIRVPVGAARPVAAGRPGHLLLAGQPRGYVHRQRAGRARLHESRPVLVTGVYEAGAEPERTPGTLTRPRPSDDPADPPSSQTPRRCAVPCC